MTENQWSKPEGYPPIPKSVRYRIRECIGRDCRHDVHAEINGKTLYNHTPGDVVERKTGVAYDSPTSAYFHGLDSRDQHIADRVTSLIQRACSYFYADEWEQLGGVNDIVISDAAVIERIRRIEQGENRREAMRTKKEYYRLSELPWEQQRALVEQIEDLKRTWGFEFVGEAE